MQVFLYRDGKANVVHASENNKKTGCGINLQKPENMAKFSKGGSVSDSLSLLNEVNCEKCQNVFVKKMMKQDNKERAAMAKEEKKRGKGHEDENMVSLAAVQEEKRKAAKRKAGQGHQRRKHQTNDLFHHDHSSLLD
ncbi:MAG: hypothetical protein IJ055_02225 [Oscillospiraceae bacterium]|nr:hypothetical protein [Oscillospiraceae bacterium]